MIIRNLVFVRSSKAYSSLVGSCSVSHIALKKGKKEAGDVLACTCQFCMERGEGFEGYTLINSE